MNRLSMSLSAVLVLWGPSAYSSSDCARFRVRTGSPERVEAQYASAEKELATYTAISEAGMRDQGTARAKAKLQEIVDCGGRGSEETVAKAREKLESLGISDAPPTPDTAASRKTKKSQPITDKEAVGVLVAEKVAGFLAKDDIASALDYYTDRLREKSLAQMRSSIRTQSQLEATGGAVKQISAKMKTRDKSSAGQPLLRVEVVVEGVNKRRITVLYDLVLGDDGWKVFAISGYKAVPPL